MKSNGQIAYEAFCACIQWLQPKMESWPKIGSAARDAWESAGEAVAIKVKEEYESQAEEDLTRVKDRDKI